jgi:hypothetical protein
MRRFCFRLFVLAALALIPAGTGVVAATAVKGAEEKVVALPPFMVEELAKGPPWRYANSQDFEILSKCDDTTTKQVSALYYRWHRLLELILPPGLQVRQDVPRTAIYYDEQTRTTASQEVIEQMLRSKAGSPQPAGGTMPLGSRGFRGYEPAPPRYTFMPNLRLRDKDAMAVFTVLRPGEVDGEGMGLAQDYIEYLLRLRTPGPPVWFVAGFVSMYPKVHYKSDHLLVEKGEWISAAETDLLKDDPTKARPLLPLEGFFRGDASANNQSIEDNRRVWASQAELLVRWALSGPQREGFWKLVERAAEGPMSETLVQECLGLDYPQLSARLTAYLPVAVRKSIALRPKAEIVMPALTLRNATDSEIARIKGDWERLEISYVRTLHPEVVDKYIEQARRTLMRAYDRESRDPRLLATLGLLECDVGNPVAARGYLETAASLGVVRPRAWLELGKLRLAAQLAAPGADGKLSPTQAVEVLTPLFTARRQQPPLAEVYDTIAEVWEHSAVPPTAAHLGVLKEGLYFFPRRVSLVRRTAALLLSIGATGDAAMYVDWAQRLATDDDERARLAELPAKLPAATPPSTPPLN